MNSRFSRDDRGPRDDRYIPRDRERYDERRPSAAPFGSSYNSRVDDYGLSASRDPVPRGPRGRGYGPDFSSRGNPYEFDRRERRPPPARPPPGRDRDDSRDRGSVRDIDTDRARPHSREGPQSAGSNLSDPPRTSNTFRGGYARGRGRTDYYTPGRTFSSDAPDTFRPGRDRSVDSREFDYREQRENDRRPFRGGDERDDPYLGRDQRRADARPDFASRAPPYAPLPLTPQGERPPNRPAITERSTTGDLRSDYDATRRGSTISDQGLQKDTRGDAAKRDVRADDSRYQQRAASPPAAVPPSVPQFGAFRMPGQMGWINRATQNKSTSTTSSATAPQLPKGPPTAPKAQMPPTAPKADRVFEQSRVSTEGGNVMRNSENASVSNLSLPSRRRHTRWHNFPYTNRFKAQLKDLRVRFQACCLNLSCEESKAGFGRECDVDAYKALHRSGISLPDHWHSRYGKALSPGTTSATPVQNRDDASTSIGLAGRSPVPPSAPRAMTQPHAMLNSNVSPTPSAGDLVHARQMQIAPKAAVTASSSRTTFPENVPTGPRAERALWSRAAPNVLGVPPSPSPQHTINPPIPPPPDSPPPPPPDFLVSIVPAKRSTTDKDNEHPNAGQLTSLRDVDGGRESKVPRIAGSSSAPEAILADDHELSSRKAGTTQVHPLYDMTGPTLEMKDAPVQDSGIAQKLITGANSSSEDEGIFDEADFAKHEAAYAEKRQRQSQQVVELSTKVVRTTTPVEQVSILFGMMSVGGTVEFKLLPPVAGIQRDEAPRQSDESAALMILDDDVEDTEMASSESSTDSELLLSSPEPLVPLRDAPTPLTLPEQFFAVRQNDIASQLKEKLAITGGEEAVEGMTLNLQSETADLPADQEANLENQYLDLYRVWRANVDEMDKARQRAEKQAEKESPRPEEAPVGPETPSVLMITPTEGGRRTHKFSSEYDMERVIEESKREEEERRRKAAIEEGEANSAEEREADIPAMLTPDEIAKRREFRDTNQLRESKDAIRIFEFAPPKDTFTHEEDELLRRLYDKNNKAWGQIARSMREQMDTERTYKECINHYYSTKFEKPYKKPNAKGKRKGPIGSRKTGRGGRVVQSFTNLDQDIEMADGESSVQVTDSGRPRRAAAPKFGPPDVGA